MNASNTKKTNKYRWDILLILVVLFVALAILLVVNLTRQEGSVAVVEIDGMVAGTYPLSQNGTFSLNGGTNVLVIENGTARLVQSNCPDHTCENVGAIRYVGQTIVCLPNRLTVTIRGNSSGGVDFVS